MLITKARMAEIAGVSRAAITRSCKGGALKSAVCQDKIDTTSESARAYIRKKGLDPAQVFGQSDIEKSDIQSCNKGSLDLRDVKIKTEIERNRLNNAKVAGKLISRSLVKFVIDLIDAVFTTLLTDTCKTMAIRAKAMFGSGSDIDDVIEMMRDQISSVIRPAKNKAHRSIENA